MNSEDIADFLERLFAEHDLPAQRHEDWVVPGGTFPAIRAHWRDSETGNRVGSLTVQVALADGRQIQEIFAGVGDGAEGCMDAMKSFITVALHVLMSGLWEKASEDVVRSVCDTDSGRWILHATNFVYRGPAEGASAVPSGLLPLLEQAIFEATLAPGEHWISALHANMGDGQEQTQLLLDNEPWEDGTKLFETAGWRNAEHYYSARGFALLIPDMDDF